MITVRLSKTQWFRAWCAMIEIGPVQLIADDPVYEVSPDHLTLLRKRGFTYEVLPTRPQQPENHLGMSDHQE